MKRAHSQEYFIHLRRLVRIISGDYSRDISKLGSKRGRSNTIEPRLEVGSAKSISKRETLGEYQRKWDIKRQNRRLAHSIQNTSPVLSFQRSEAQYKKHLKDRKVLSRQTYRKGREKEVRLVDVVWRGEHRNCREVLTIQIAGSSESRSGTLDELRLLPIKFKRNEKPMLFIEGQRKQGLILVSKMSVVPILHKQRHVGQAVLDISAL